MGILWIGQDEEFRFVLAWLIGFTRDRTFEFLLFRRPCDGPRPVRRQILGVSGQCTLRLTGSIVRFRSPRAFGLPGQ